MNEAAKIRRATYHLYTLTICKLISTFGSSIYAFGISLYVLSITGSAASFAINLICGVLPRSLIAPFAGYAADSYSKKKLVIFSQAASGLAVAGLLLFSLAFGLSLPAVYVTTALISVSSMFTGVTFTSSIANLIDPDRIQKAIGFNQSAMSIATIGGPVIGGMLFGFISMNAFLAIQILAYAMALLLESTMNFKLFTSAGVKGEAENQTMVDSMKEGVAYLKTNRVIMLIVTVAIGINFFFSALMIGLPFIAVRQLKIQSAHFGIIEGMIAAGMLLASIYFAVRKEVKFPLLFSKRAILVLSALLGAIALPLVLDLPYEGNVGYLIVLMFIFGGSNICVNTPIGVMMQKDVEEKYRGRVLGILDSMCMAMMPLGYLVFGLLFDAVPAQYVVWGSSLCLILLTLYMMRPSVVKEAYPELVQATVDHPEFR